MKELAISPNFKIYADGPGVVVDFRTKREYLKNETQTKILVYEDRVTGWFLNYGRMLQEHHNAAFVVLQVALAQVEGIEQYHRGESSEGQSSDFFRSGLKKIFSLTDADDPWLWDFYRFVRCGLFHDGMTRPRVLIENRFPRALEFDGKCIRISPNKFLDAVIGERKGSYLYRLTENGDFSKTRSPKPA
jgi:hypothetical protein